VSKSSKAQSLYGLKTALVLALAVFLLWGICWWGVTHYLDKADRGLFGDMFGAVPANATASAPAGKRSCFDVSFAARHTASATSVSFVTAAGFANAAKMDCA